MNETEKRNNRAKAIINLIKNPDVRINILDENLIEIYQRSAQGAITSVEIDLENLNFSFWQRLKLVRALIARQNFDEKIAKENAEKEVDDDIERFKV